MNNDKFIYVRNNKEFVETEKQQKEKIENYVETESKKNNMTKKD